jgi:16S rRNA (adenine1518-N6/adenine1519-N6)-dimethyltransferase
MKNDIELTVRQVIHKYGLLKNKGRAKSFGQHFLCDSSLLNKIVSCSFPLVDTEEILEIGPGPGGLTRAIMENSTAKVYCIEKDISMKPIHDSLLNYYSNDRIQFIYQDAMTVKISDLTSKKVAIISNLPYNIGTRFLLKLLKDLKQISKIVLTLQKEVVNRIVSKTNQKSYGRLSVISQILCAVEKKFDITNKAFYPPPKVFSSVVKLVPKNSVNLDIVALEKLTGSCFSQRRKTMFSSMRQHYSEELLENALRKCQIEKNSRPESISPCKFFQLLSEL